MAIAHYADVEIGLFKLKCWIEFRYYDNYTTMGIDHCYLYSNDKEILLLTSEEEEIEKDIIYRRSIDDQYADAEYD